MDRTVSEPNKLPLEVVEELVAEAHDRAPVWRTGCTIATLSRPPNMANNLPPLASEPEPGQKPPNKVPRMITTMVAITGMTSDTTPMSL